MLQQTCHSKEYVPHLEKSVKHRDKTVPLHLGKQPQVYNIQEVQYAP
jgi:hypothetical protein